MSESATLEFIVHVRSGEGLPIEETGDYLKPVNTTPIAVKIDEASREFFMSAPLPFAGGSATSREAIDMFARVISRKKDEKDGKNGKLTYFKTETSGRATYIAPAPFKVGDREITMSTVMMKGSGSSDSLEKTTASPFLYGGDGIVGAATMGDLRLDAQNSFKLYSLGIRTRIPLVIFNLEKIPCNGKTYTPDGLKKAGIVKKNEDLPGIGVFASKTFLKMNDLADFLKDHDPESPEIGGLLKYFLETTKTDEALEFQQFHQRHEGLSVSERKTVMFDFCLALSGVIGRNAAGFEKAKAAKGHYEGLRGMYVYEETPDNTNCMGESVDNSEVVFEATTEQVGTFQASLLKILSRKMSFKRFCDSRENIAIKELMAAKFIDAYLDEMKPGWREISDEANFIDLESRRLSVDRTVAQRAYWVTKLKHDAIVKESQDGGALQEPSDLKQSVSGLLGEVLSDFSYEKTELFCLDYSNSFITSEKI